MVEPVHGEAPTVDAPTPPKRNDDAPNEKGSSVAAPKTGAKCERRRGRRRPVLLKAHLYQGGQVFDCLVNNLSSFGAGVIVEVHILKGAIDVNAGSVITLTIEGLGDFPGTIAWHDTDHAGIRFMQEPGEVDGLLNR